MASYEIPMAVQQWLDALRSGAYKQGRHTLRSSDNYFCCLGVACDILNPNVWGNGASIDSLASYMLPSEWTAFVGPDAAKILCQVHLASLNDSGAYTFKQIADYVEGVYKRGNV